MIKYSDDIMKTIEAFINQSKTIALISHKDPDGDCLGSLLGLYHILKELKIEASLFVEGEIPNNLDFLPKIDEINSKPDNITRDLAIVLDSSDKNRIGIMHEVLSKAKTSIAIDHHISNNSFCDINLVKSSYSSTGEIIFEMAKKLQWSVNKSAAMGLYTAMLTDTGRFIYDSTSSQTLRFVADIIDLGIDFNDIAMKIYSSDSKEVYLAKSKIVSEAKFYFEDRLSIAVIDQVLLDSYAIKMKDIDGVVELIRDIKNVEIACLLKEVGKNKTKVSLRSKGDIDVSEISLCFNGGGHVKAAGFNLDLDILQSKNILLDHFKQLFEA
ncbi:MAG: bifunctional oligoribonuclease/PAP phosphatase NrnA [Tissierellales bacterium]|nr:bifunctional oligoribonuclease/PAP phosphatase NrnA [Tissierellales bacterium]MBN2828303.1 bifunctional oligoribonuclease/PAP phosphatase NrnA [Tissierellales bacterium]